MKILGLIKKLFFYGLGLVLVAILSGFAINDFMETCTSDAIKSTVSEIKPAYTAIVLGSKVFSEDRISNMVKHRCDRAIELYNTGKVQRILVSGDHGTKEYDEVNAMKNYLEKMGVPSSDIFMDHAGFNTYDTMIRAKKVFQVDNAIIVTQEFHLARSIYIAQHAEIDVQGVIAEDSPYLNLEWITHREQLARVKSFAEVLLDRDPKYLGEPIPITGSSFASHD